MGHPNEPRRIQQRLAPHTRRWVRRAAGLLWLVVWVAVLRVAHRPWEILGGAISERMRWLERLVLGLGLIVGCCAGRYVRDAAQVSPERCHANALRNVWIPPAALAAAAMILAPDWRWKLLTLVAVCSYSAGVDVAVGAWPLLNGRHYTLLGRILSEEERPESESDRP